MSVSCLVKPEAKMTVRFKNNTSSWTTLFGTSDAETYSTWITVDSNSNIYSVGFLDGGTEDFEGQTRINSTDSFVSKFDFDGNKTWTKVFGTSSGEDIVFYAATTDSNGNIFVTGYVAGNFNGETKTGANDFILIKLNSEGDIQWSSMLGTSGVTAVGNNLKIYNDQIYVVGYSTGNIDGKTSTGTKDLMLLKYNQAGVLQASNLLGVAGVDTVANAIEIMNDYIYVTGDTSGDLSGETLNGIKDAILVKYDLTLTHQWTKLLGVASGMTQSYGVVGHNNSIYLTGYTTGNLSGETLNGQSDMFVTKYDESGTQAWLKLQGGQYLSFPSVTGAQDIDVDSYGNLYVIGGTKANLADQTMTGANFNMYATKYDDSGTRLWTRLAGVSGFDTKPYSVVHHNDSIVVTGITGGNFNGESVNSTAASFITTYTSDGEN